MSRQENRNRGEKQQKKNDNKHALTSLAPPTEQIALPAVNFVKYTCCSHSILLSCCFFSRKMSQKRFRFTAEQVRDVVRAVHSGGALKSDVYVMSLPFFHCSFFRRFFGSLSWFFVLRDDWLNVCTLPVIFLQKMMRFGEIWKGVQLKHAIHSGCPIQISPW